MKRIVALFTRLTKWLQSKLRRRFDLSDFVAQPGVRQLGPHAFFAESSDPSFHLGLTLEPGTYRVALKARVPYIDTHRVHATAQFFLDEGQGESEANSWLLPFQNNVVASGILPVAKRARLRFDPIEHRGPFDLADLAVTRLSPSESNKTVGEAMLRPADRLATGITPYAQWLEQNHERPPIGGADSTPPWRLLVIVIDRLADPSAGQRSVASVLAQAGGPWELHHLRIGHNGRQTPAADPRYKVHAIESGQLAASLRTIAASSTAQGLLMLVAGDTLPEHALQKFAQAGATRPAATLFYGDQDFRDRSGFRCNPFFKADWSPDLFYTYNYLGRAVALNKAVYLSHPATATPEDASAWHALLCAMVTSPASVVHIPCIVYHQADPAEALAHPEARSLAIGSTTASEALLSAIERQESTPVQVEQPSRRLIWGEQNAAAKPVVSIIVPTRDGHALLSRCIESLGRLTAYPRIELIVVDNGSTCPDTLKLLKQVAANLLGFPAIKSQVVNFDAPFNYSAINNLAVAQASGEVLVFLNNDIEITHADWLCELVQQARRPTIGCVGAQLLFPNGNIQHAGIVLGLGGVAGHVHRGDPSIDPGYFGRLTRVQNVSAVTGAAMAMRKALFSQLGGFDEGALAVAYNDVDLCLKALQAGYRNIVTPHARLIHHESASRGSDTQPTKRKRLEVEERTMYARWGDIIARDPHFNPNLSLRREDVQLSEGEGNP